MVSAIGPESHSDQIAKSLVHWGCGNEQRLTIDVTPSPRLEDLWQGLRMPGHAPYLSRGYSLWSPDYTTSRGYSPWSPDSQRTVGNSGPPLLGGTTCPFSPVVTVILSRVPLRADPSLARFSVKVKVTVCL